MSATSYINTAGNGSSSTSSIACNKPTNTAENDIMIAVVGHLESSVTPPSGWTFLKKVNIYSTFYVSYYYKVAGASEPSSYTWGFSSSSSARVQISTYRGGFDTSDPIYIANVYGGVTTNPILSPDSDFNIIFTGGCYDIGGSSWSNLGVSGWTWNFTAGDGYSDFYMGSSITNTTGNSVLSTPAKFYNGDYPSLFQIVLKPSGLSTDLRETGITQKQETSAVSSITIDNLIGVKENDLMIVSIVNDYNASTSITPPTGWTLLAEGRSKTTSVYYKVAGSSEPSSYTFSVSPSLYIEITLISYRGDYNTSNPIVGYSNTTYTTYDKKIRIGSINAPVSGLTMVMFPLISGTGYYITAPSSPSGITQLFEGTVGTNRYKTYKVKLTSSGDTGNIDFTIGANYEDKHGIGLIISPLTIPSTSGMFLVW